MKKIIFYVFVVSLFIIQNVSADYINAWRGYPSAISKDCPKDKPFTGRDHLKDCVGCDTKSPLLIADGHEKDFNICPNRVTIGDESYLKTGNGLELWNGNKKWNPCTDIEQYEIAGERIYSMNGLKVSRENCESCSPCRKYSEDGNCHVVKSPLPDRPLIETEATRNDDNVLVYSYKLHNCSSKIWNLKSTPEDCAKCLNRKYLSEFGYCYQPKECPEGEFFTLEYGCQKCDSKHIAFYDEGLPIYTNENDIRITTPEECSKCPNRMYIQEDILLDKKDIESEKMSVKYTYLQEKGCFLVQKDNEILRLSHAEYIINKKNKEISPKKWVIDSGFRTCDTAEEFYTLPEICIRCSNREYKEGLCILKK